jgi:hypothetical protein
MGIYWLLQQGSKLGKVDQITYKEVAWQEHFYFVVK